MSTEANLLADYQDSLPLRIISVVRPAAGTVAYVGYSVVGTIKGPDGEDHDVLAMNVINKSDPVAGQMQNATRKALTDALNAVALAITQPDGLAADILALTAAVDSLTSPIDGQLASTQAMATSMAALLAQQQSNGQAQAAILASNLRQEALLASIAANTGAIDADLKAAQAQAHADAQSELSGIQATNAALATAHSDAQAQLAQAQAAATQAHQDAQAQGTALALLHADDAALQTALALLHTDQGSLLAAVQSLLSTEQGEATTLSALSTSNASVLTVLRAILAGGTPFSGSPGAGATVTLFQAGANGSVISALGATSTSTLGTILLSIFSTPTATGTSGTLLQTVELVVGANAPVLQNIAIPANAYVRATASILGATVFGARKDL